MRGSKGKKFDNDDENQTKCLINTEGHMWMRSYFDDLPKAVRQRLRDSPFNLCPACLQTEVLPRLDRRKYPNREKALFAAVEIMEVEVRKEDYRSSHPLTSKKEKV
jgi:hypothetical protein